MTVRLTKLPSGLRVVTESMPELKSAAVGVWAGVGARFEVPQRNGISHMLEHMAFKGTRRRCARQIAEEVEDAGGVMNAYTGREFTGYFLRVLGKDVPLALDILADILQDSVFDSTELERERGVILQEIGEAADTPDDLVFDHLQETAYPEQPLGRAVLGTAETVGTFTADDLFTHMHGHYRAGGMVLAAAGQVEHDRIVEFAARQFDRISEGQVGPPAEARYKGGLNQQPKDLEQVHIALAFDGVAYRDPDYYATQVFANLLGGGMSSRLFQEVREERGLAYSIHSFAGSYRDGGLFGVYAGTGPEQATELLDVVADTIWDVSAAGVSQEELERARAQLKAAVVMSLESPASRIEQMARQLLIYGRVLDLDDMVAEIDAVGRAAVRRVAERILAVPPSLAMVGPMEGIRIPGQLRK